MTKTTVIGQEHLNIQLQELHQRFIDKLRTLPLKPERWLPHIVYVEEEGDYPVYTMYQLEEVCEDGSCVLFNPKTGERFSDRYLHEINIEWLDTILRWYKECCIEHDIWQEHARIVLKRQYCEIDNAIQEFVDTMWQKEWSDDENIMLFNEWLYPHKPTFERNDFLKLTDDAISTIKERFGNEAAEYRKNMILRVLHNKRSKSGIWMTEVRDIDEDDIQEFCSSMLRPITVNELQYYVLNTLDKH